jgi:hypothetical protein
MGAGNSVFSQAGNQATGQNNPFAGSANPYIQATRQTTLGNLAGAQQAVTANRVNQSTPYQNLNYSQTGTDANGNPIWSATQSLAQPFQQSLSNLASNVGQQTSQAFNPTNLPSTGINPGQTYSDAIMQRLQPQQDMQKKQFDAQMANQGIAPGTEAYANAARVFGQQQNDALTSAVIGGMQTGLTANQQAFNQQLQTYNNPLQQLGAFNQATQANYVNPAQQAAVAAPDYLGAYTTSNAADIAAQNAQLARTANMQSGLYGLGNAALIGGGGLGGALGSLGTGLSGLSSLFGNSQNYTNPYANYSGYLNSAGSGLTGIE